MIRSTASQLPGESAFLDSQKLLTHITGRTRAWLLSHPEASLTPDQNRQLESAIQKLRSGIPLPYVLGRWEFYGLDFIVTPDVLIPRPETELLVETALAFTRSHPQAEYKILDVGTGSGIIPISLGVHIPQARLVGTDVSPAALAIAKKNASLHGLEERITFIETDLAPEDLPLSDFDIICANLPYIPTDMLKTLVIYGREPTLALDGGLDGMDLIRRLVEKLGAVKKRASLYLFEIEQSQGPAVSQHIERFFPGAAPRIQRDLAGHDRLVIF